LDGNGDSYRTAPDGQPIGDLVQGISEKASFLVREEIELARAEIEQKVKRLARGAVAGAIAGFFVLLGLLFAMIAAAYALSDVLDNPFSWAGFLIVAGVLFLLAALGGLFALRSFKKGAPPTPDQAIEEAKLIREAIEHPEVQAAMSSQAKPREG
jgi:uncharacterized membrane protein YqjE